MAEDVGAGLLHMDKVQLYPLGLVDPDAAEPPDERQQSGRKPVKVTKWPELPIFEQAIG